MQLCRYGPGLIGTAARKVAVFKVELHDATGKRLWGNTSGYPVVPTILQVSVYAHNARGRAVLLCCAMRTRACFRACVLMRIWVFFFAYALVSERAHAHS